MHPRSLGSASLLLSWLGCADPAPPPDAELPRSDAVLDARPDATTDIATDIATDVPTDIATDIATDIRTDIATDIRTDIATDIRTDIATDIRTDIATDIRTDIATDAPGDIPTSIDRPVDVPADAPADAVVGPLTRVTVAMFHYDVQHSGANRNELALTPAALRSGRFGRDTAFAPALDGDVYGQPLYVPDVSVAGVRRDVLIVATQANSVYGLNAVTGAVLWRASFEPAVALVRMPCGNVGPTTGIVSTPVYDPATGLVWAMPYNSLDGGFTRRFTLHAVEVATGRERTELAAVVNPPASNGSVWDASAQGQRGALSLVDGRVYASFGGLHNDCSVYHGWVVGLDVLRPVDQLSFATTGVAAGIWAYGGLAGDGAGHLFATTGNGRTPGSMGSYVVRLGTRPRGPTWRNVTTDYYTASNRDYMDRSDSDLGAISPISLPDHPGSRTPHMLFQGSKHGQGYLLNRDDLGGQGVVRPPISEAVYSEGMYAQGLYGAAAAWSDGRNVLIFAPGRGARARCATGVGGVTTLRLRFDAAGSSAFEVAWCTGSISNPSAPTVSSNGDLSPVLWLAGTTPPELRAYDVATGEEVYATRGADTPASARQWVPPVVVDGRVYVTGSNTVWLYRLR